MVKVNQVTAIKTWTFLIDLSSAIDAVITQPQLLPVFAPLQSFQNVALEVPRGAQRPEGRTRSACYAPNVL